MDPDPERRPGMACRRPHRYAQGVRRPASPLPTTASLLVTVGAVCYAEGQVPKL